MKRFAMGAAALLVSSMAALSANAQDKVSVRTDWFHSSYHAPFFVGIEKGFYKDAGIELKVTEGRGSGQVVQLVGKGDDQFGFSAVESIMRGVSVGIPVTSVATIMPVMGQAIYVLSKSNINTPADLKGKTIAITPGGTNEALLPAVLQIVGLKESDVKQVAVDPAAKLRMMLNGDFDSMMATGWAHSLFDAAGGARAFIYSDYGVKIVGYSIVANQDVVKKNPDMVKRFIAATARSWEYAQRNPEEAVDALAKNSPPNADPARRKGNSIDFANSLKFVGPAVPGKPFGTQSDKDWKDTQALLLQYKVLEKEMPISAYMTNEFVAGGAATN